MRLKATALTAALVFGLIAAVGIAVYLNSLASSVKREGRKIKVYVAVKPVRKGTAVEELTAKKLIKRQAVPRRYLADGAVVSLKAVNGKVLTTPLSRGEQLTTAKFRSPGAKSMLPYVLRSGRVAVTIPVDKFSGIDFRLNPGDKLTIYGTFKTTRPGGDFTRLLIANVPVIAVEKPPKSKSGAAATTNKQSLTLAVPVEKAPRLVFAAEAGSVWAALQKRGDKYNIAPAKTPTTSVEVNIDSISPSK